MAICATSHALPDGTVVIALDAQNLNLTTCEMVVITGAEFNSELMNFTPDDGLLVAGAIGLLWAVAFTFRVIRQSLDIGNKNEIE